MGELYLIQYIHITDSNKSLTTLVVNHYNDLLDKQTSKLGRNEVTFSYVWDVRCIYLGTKYADFPGFQEKIFTETSSGKKFLRYYNGKFGTFSQKFQRRFFLENRHTYSPQHMRM